MAESLNPYAAPQTQELQPSKLPSAMLAETASLVAAPPEVRRWVKAALWLYWISFVVPYAPWFWTEKPIWYPGFGVTFCILGMFAFWYPPMFSWWANVMFWIAYRDLNRVTSGKALGYAVSAVVLAPVIGILELLGPLLWQHPIEDDPFLPGPIMTSAPYLCWLGSMVLMLIAALKMRRVVREKMPDNDVLTA